MRDAGHSWAEIAKVSLLTYFFVKPIVADSFLGADGYFVADSYLVVGNYFSADSYLVADYYLVAERFTAAD